MSASSAGWRLACLVCAALANSTALPQQLPTLPGAPGQSNEPAGEIGTGTGLGAPGASPSANEPDEAELARRTAVRAARERGWLFLPSMGLREIGTDNAPMATSAGRESDLISSLSASVTLYVRQPRFEADGSYALEFDDYAAGHGSNRILANGGVAGTFDVADHRLFLSGGWSRPARSTTRSASNPTSVRLRTSTASPNSESSPISRASLSTRRSGTESAARTAGHPDRRPWQPSVTARTRTQAITRSNSRSGR